MSDGSSAEHVADTHKSGEEHESRPSVALALLILVLGLAGVASLALLPLEQSLPEGIDVPRAVLLLNPAILTIIAVLAGWFAAPRAGLGAPALQAMLGKGDWATPLRAAIGPAIIVALIGMATLLAYGAVTADLFASDVEQMAQPVVTRLLYGGVTEEILLRWGMMSVLALLLLKLRLPRGAALWSANVVAALLFGLGHFPMLYALMPEPPLWLLALVLGANAGLGILFGWLYMRRGLEAAIIGHALTHLFAVLAAAFGAALSG